MTCRQSILLALIIMLISSLPAFPANFTNKTMPPAIPHMVSDLGFVNININPDSIIAGNYVQVSGSIQNYSSQEETSIYVKYYLSNDSIYDAADDSIGYYYLNTIYGDNSRYIYKNISIPNHTPEGYYYIVTRLVDSNDEYDSNPQNNTAYKKIKVLLPEVDVRITSIDLSTNNFFIGSGRGISYHVENIGNTNASNFQMGFYLSDDFSLDATDKKIEEDNIYRIYPNDENSFYNWLNIPDGDFEEGIYYLIINADDGNILNETNEQNNLYITQVLITRREPQIRNLKINEIYSKTDTLTNGEYINLSINMDLIPYQSIKIATYLSSDSILDINRDILLGSEYRKENYSKDYTIREYFQFDLTQIENIDFGTNYLISMIDPDSSITEENENDNIAYTSLYIDSLEYPDLSVSDFTTSGDTTWSGMPFDLRCIITNSGSNQINPEISYFLSEDAVLDESDMKVSDDNLQTLNAGLSRNSYETVTFEDVSSGAYWILCVADPQNTIEETNEANNILTNPVYIFDDSIEGKNDIILKNIILNDTLYKKAISRVEMEFISFYAGNSLIDFGCFLSEDSVFDAADLSRQLFTSQLFNPGYIQETIYREFIISEQTDTGKHYLIFKADYKNHLFEDNELNNVIIKPAVILPEPSTIDLFVENARSSTSIHYPSSLMEGSFTCSNTGTLEIDTAFYKVYIKEKADSSEGQLIHMDTIYNLGVNPKVVSLSFFLPDTLKNGLHNIVIELSSSSEIQDLNPENNSTSFTIGIQDPDIDLVMNNLQINGQVFETLSMHLNYETTNTGSTLVKNVKYHFYLSEDNVLSSDDILLDSSLLELNRIGTSMKNEIFINYPSVSVGKYYFMVFIDPVNSLPESDETNNISVLEVDILPSGSNLTIEEVKLESSEIAFNIDLEIETLIRNSGNEQSSSTYINYYLSSDSIHDEDDHLISQFYLGSMYANYSSKKVVNLKIDEIVPEGNYYLNIVVDPDDKVSEIDEDDNHSIIPVTLVNAEIDLEISGEEIPNPFITTNESSYLDFGIINNGRHGFYGISHIKMYISLDSILNPLEDYHLVEQQEYFSVASGETDNKRIYLPLNDLKQGKFFLFIQIDPYNTTREANEENNIVGIPMEIIEPERDLIVSELSLPEGTVMENGYISYDIQIMNKGRTSINQYFRNRIYLSSDTILDENDHYLESFSIYSLNASETYNRSSSIRLPEGYAGNQYFICKTDADGNIDETNEDNNTSYAPIIIEAPDIDIIVKNQRVNSEEINLGDIILIECEIGNQGNIGTEGYFFLGYFLSRDTILDDSDMQLEANFISSLEANTFYSNSLSPIISGVYSGTYYILIKADFDNRIHESSETNNLVYIPVNINTTGAKSDYSIDYFYHLIYPEYANINFSIVNKGFAIGDENIDCYIFYSRDAKWDEEDSLINSFPIEPLSGIDSMFIENYEVSLNVLYYKYIVIAIDPDNRMEETNEENNIRIIELPPPNFDIEINTDPTEIEALIGETLTVQSDISTLGVNPLDSILFEYILSVDEKIDDSDTIILSNKIPSLDHGEQLTIEQEIVIPSNIAEGIYTLIIQVNSDTSWIEVNQNNNTAFIYYNLAEEDENTSYSAQKSNLVIYPNPASEILNIRSGLRMEAYKIVDSRGRMIINGLINSTSKQIVLDGFKDGIYFLMLKTEKYEKVIRFEVIR